MCAQRYDHISAISRNREWEQMRCTIGETPHASSPDAKEPHGSTSDARVILLLCFLLSYCCPLMKSVLPERPGLLNCHK